MTRHTPVSLCFLFVFRFPFSPLADVTEHLCLVPPKGRQVRSPHHLLCHTNIYAPPPIKVVCWSGFVCRIAFALSIKSSSLTHTTLTYTPLTHTRTLHTRTGRALAHVSLVARATAGPHLHRGRARRGGAGGGLARCPPPQGPAPSSSCARYRSVVTSLPHVTSSLT
jgi:hypothetical protein